MGRRERAATGWLALALTLVAAGPLAAGAHADEPQPPSRVLVYSATYGYRHASIETAKKQFKALEDTGDFHVELTENPASIDADVLERFDAVVFVSATGEQPWSARQRQDLLDWLAEGNGIVATHASIDGSYYWSDYGDIVGGYFFAHPHTGVATNVVEDRDSPFMAHLPERFDLNEEYYRLQLDPRPNVRVLASLDNESMGHNGHTYVDDQPITWCQEVGGGRAWTTGWGHFDASYTDPRIWTAMVQGLRWAAGRIGADCEPLTPQPAGRVQAEDADQIALAAKESSPFDGANQVVTGIRHGAYLKFDDVDLTGVSKITASVSPETAPDPQPYQLPQSRPALGGNITVLIDEHPYAGQALSFQPPNLTSAASMTVPPGDVPATVGDGVLGHDGVDWRTVDLPIPAGAAGTHDVYLVFTNPIVAGTASTAIFAPQATNDAHLMSVDWLQFGG